MVVAAGSAKLVLLLTARLNSRKPVTIRRVCSTSGTRATCSTSALATWGARGRRARAQRSCARPHSREGCTCSLDREALARALRGAVRTHKLVSVEHAQRYAERVGIPSDLLSQDCIQPLAFEMALLSSLFHNFSREKTWHSCNHHSRTQRHAFCSLYRKLAVRAPPLKYINYYLTAWRLRSRARRRDSILLSPSPRSFVNLPSKPFG